MATALRSDLIAIYKKETIINLKLLHKLQPMELKSASLIFNDHGMEKPTQTLFNNITYYLLSIIDSQAHASLIWPLSYGKDERQYRNSLSKFISDYASKGLLTPVMSFYLVKPGCYNVTVLLFQLTLLAVKRMLDTKIKDSKKDLYNNITHRYKSDLAKDFINHMDSATYEDILFSKLSDFLRKKQLVEQMAELLRTKITQCEQKLSRVNGQLYVNKLIDGFVEKYELDELSKNEICKIKNFDEQSTIFDDWLKEVDKEIDTLEADWNTKALPFMEKCKNMHQLSEGVIQRRTGEIHRSTYTLEYNHKTDEICTIDLQNQVNSEQKFILCNLQNGGRLNFPNLIRAFLISVCYILRNRDLDDDIFNFNNNLNMGKRLYSDLLLEFRFLLERLDKADSKLQPTSITVYVQNDCIEQTLDIPPLPNLSGLKFNQDHYHTLFDAFTPLNFYKHQFNVRRRSTAYSKLQPRSTLTPFYQVPKEDFLKSIIPNRVDYDFMNVSRSSHNMSIISNIRANETIGECSSGFTKQQITRLLSTKKSSSSKKLRNKDERTDIKIIKGGLFNETLGPNEMFRSYSSPDLYENKEKRIFSNLHRRKLSIMQEDIVPQHEVSGVAFLNSNFNTPTGLENAEVSRNNTSRLPTITSDDQQRLENFANSLHVDFDSGLENIMSPILESSKILGSPLIEQAPTPNIVTPKVNPPQSRKSCSSLERIINRFRKICANSNPNKDEDIRTIVEEKDVNACLDNFSANRNLLPDLLSPSSSLLNEQCNSGLQYLESVALELDKSLPRKPRESLGTALGVDPTFLDQFDLIE